MLAGVHMYSKFFRTVTRPTINTPWYSSPNNPYQKWLDDGMLVSVETTESDDGLHQTRTWITRSYDDLYSFSIVRHTIENDADIIEYKAEFRQHNDNNNIDYSSPITIQVYDDDNNLVIQEYNSQ